MADTTPVTFESEMAKARRLLLAKRFGEARPIYERLIAEYPQRYQPYHRLAVVADHQQQHREAEKLYFRAIRLNRHDAEVFNDLGYCLYSQGKLAEAERILKQAVTMNPRSARFRNNLGLVLGRLGRYDEAFAQFRRGGRQADALHNLAVIRAAGGETGIRWVPYVEGSAGGRGAAVEQTATASHGVHPRASLPEASRTLNSSFHRPSVLVETHHSSNIPSSVIREWNRTGT